ncbi:hypothetical protein BHE74_00001757 [Ensete ventricosum]|nr:hypothetical protein BHE74_00001757 [Ensete ventricosum]RZR77719.1 hypothetical protein BHM03_00002844 [Ensete ventricosum]
MILENTNCPPTTSEASLLARWEGLMPVGEQHGRRQVAPPLRHRLGRPGVRCRDAGELVILGKCKPCDEDGGAGEGFHDD